MAFHNTLTIPRHATPVTKTSYYGRAMDRYEEFVMPNRTTVEVSTRTLERLERLKNKRGLRSKGVAIDQLLDFHERHAAAEV